MTREEKRTKATFYLSARLLAELRSASVALPPRVIGGNLSALAERALTREVMALRRRHNGGRAFKARGAVRRGRPPKP